MPEELEKQLKPQELADLFALLTLGQTARRPGRASSCRARRPSCRARPTIRPSSLTWCGRLRRVSRSRRSASAGWRSWPSRPAARACCGPARSAGRSRASCGHCRRARGQTNSAGSRRVARAGRGWNLAVNADGKRLHQSLVGGADRAQPAWQTISFDLSALAGKTANLELIAGTQTANSTRPIGVRWRSFPTKAVSRLAASGGRAAHRINRCQATLNSHLVECTCMADYQLPDRCQAQEGQEEPGCSSPAATCDCRPIRSAGRRSRRWNKP